LPIHRLRTMSLLRRWTVLVLVGALAGGVSFRQEPGASAADSVVRNPGDPFYQVSLRTGPQGRVWAGTVQISFANLEQAALSQVYLRLWSNGVDGCATPAITVWELEGGTLGPGFDCTEVAVALDKPLAHGERATLSMRLRIVLPRRSDRFGIQSGLALVGTALPTLEVHDDLGWHHDPFEDLGESFYSVVGNYRVTLVAPAGLDTPATGVEVGRQEQPGGFVATTYAASDVRDFAWAAGRFETVEGSSGPTEVVVSYRAGAVTSQQARNMLAAAQKSLATFSSSFGAYPYPELDVVLGGFPSFGGMEYPTIVFSEVDRYTVAHEIAHQWWYGIVGNDQYASPWLDESFATWSEELPFDPWPSCAGYAFPSSAARLSNDMAYWGGHPGQYDTVYDGGGCMLANLAGRFGLARFKGILRDYAASHWLSVARTEDFTAAIEEAAAEYLTGFDAAAFWDRWQVDLP
jgi:hypothetical protein